MFLRKLLFHPLAAGVFTLLAGVLILSLRATWQRSQQTAQSVSVLSEQLHQTQTDVSQLEQQLSSASQSTAQEKLIRDTLLMQKPGEYIVQVPVELPARTVETETGTTTPWQEWQQLW